MNIEVLNDTYMDFLKSKIEVAPESGLNIEVGLIEFKDGTVLKPHQRDAINWALKGGRRALFEKFGLGKTIQQLIICMEILKVESGKALIVAPLGVQQEFKQDAEKKLGIHITYVRNMKDIKSCEDDIVITNYERVRDGDIDPKYFTVTSLDEASVLRGFGTKTYQTFLPKFKGVKYKYVATATPNPNKNKELIHYGGYLEIMDTGQALTRFFQRDSTKANNLTLYPHKEEEFWLWVSTWALFITKPSDLGYDDDGYDLPELKVIYHKLEVDHLTAGFDLDGQLKMFRDASLGLKDASKEKRDSVDVRVARSVEILESDIDNNYIIWHDQEKERHAIKKAWPEASEIYGSQDLDLREKRTLDFANGNIKYIATKPSISGSGCNFQRHCHKAIFMGIGYKFNDFIQAIHRIYRFLQDKEVEIHIIYMESEQSILDKLLEKWELYHYTVEKMTDIIKKYGLDTTNTIEKMARTIGINRKIQSGKLWEAIHGDSILEVAEMETNSIDLIHTSIPFGNHYEYTPSYNDFGHNENNDRFFEQMDFLTPELLRVLKPGRVAAIHVKDRVLFGNATGMGMPTMDAFHAETIFHYKKHGFAFFGMITIITDVVRENNQTYRLGWTEQCKDGSKMGVGCPEYILLFRKLPTDTSKAYADVKVSKTKEEYSRGKWQLDAHGFWRSSGDRLISADDLKDIPVKDLQKIYTKWSRGNIYNHKDHIELAENLEKDNKLPSTFMVVAPGSWNDDVIDDVNRMFTLNSSQSQKHKEKHICPLQFDIVDRIITRYSNKGDLVFDPFAGIMTVPYRAIKLGRRGKAVELNENYWNDGIKYLKSMEEDIAHPTLFDLEELEK